jgi:hypothetical protein
MIWAINKSELGQFEFEVHHPIFGINKNLFAKSSPTLKSVILVITIVGVCFGFVNNIPRTVPVTPATTTQPPSE